MSPFRLKEAAESQLTQSGTMWSKRQKAWPIFFVGGPVAGVLGPTTTSIDNMSVADY